MWLESISLHFSAARIPTSGGAEQYLGQALTAALPNAYQLAANPYRPGINRFAPY